MNGSDRNDRELSRTYRTLSGKGVGRSDISQQSKPCLLQGTWDPHFGSGISRRKQLSADEKKQAYADNTDRIEVKRGFSLAKRCYGLGLIKTKLDTTTRSSIALSIIAMNVNFLTGIYFVLFMISIFSRSIWQKNLPKKRLFNIRFQWAGC